MQKINALEVTKGEFIASKKEIIDGEIKNVNYYTANIKNLETKELVGKFATVEYIGFDNYIRCFYAPTNDYINITGDYHYLKLIQNNNNEKIFVFTNKDGTKYFTDSDEYQYKLKIINSKYTQQISDGKITNEKVNEIIAQLIEINPIALTNMDLTNRPLNTIFNVKKLGKGMVSALSLYEGEEKVSELLSESGLFKQIEGQDQEKFIFSNDLHNLYTSYNGKVYFAVEKKINNIKLLLSMVEKLIAINILFIYMKMNYCTQVSTILSKKISYHHNSTVPKYTIIRILHSLNIQIYKKNTGTP